MLCCRSDVRLEKPILGGSRQIFSALLADLSSDLAPCCNCPVERSASAQTEVVPRVARERTTWRPWGAKCPVETVAAGLIIRHRAIAQAGAGPAIRLRPARQLL